MLKNPVSESGFFNPRCLIALSLGLSGIFLVALSVAATPREFAKSSARESHSIASKHAERASTTATQGATTSGPSGPGWSLITSPNAFTTNNVVDGVTGGVTCILATNCFAVGSYNTWSAYQTLIEHWNGTSWSIITSPNVSATQDNMLNGVTCTSATQCFAVGIYLNPAGVNGSIYQTL